MLRLWTKDRYLVDIQLQSHSLCQLSSLKQYASLQWSCWHGATFYNCQKFFSFDSICRVAYVTWPAAPHGNFPKFFVFNVFVKGKHLERGARTWRVIRCTFCLLLLGFLLFPVATLTTQCFNITLTRAIWEWSKRVMSTGKKPPVLFLCSVNAIQFFIRNSTIAAATLILLAAGFCSKTCSSVVPAHQDKVFRSAYWSFTPVSLFQAAATKQQISLSSKWTMNNLSYKAMKPESNSQKVVKYKSSKVFVAFPPFATTFVLSRYHTPNASFIVLFSTRRLLIINRSD